MWFLSSMTKDMIFQAIALRKDFVTRIARMGPVSSMYKQMGTKAFLTVKFFVALCAMKLFFFRMDCFVPF